MSTHKGSNSGGSRSQEGKRPPKPIVEDMISDSEEDFEGADPLMSALFTREGLPVAEAIVYIATAISNLANNMQSYSEKSLRLQKYVAKQLQAISESLTAGEEHEEQQPEEEADSTVAQAQGSTPS